MSSAYCIHATSSSHATIIAKHPRCSQPRTPHSLGIRAIDTRKVATIASDRGMFFSTDADVERLIFDDWSPKTHKGVPFSLIDPNGGKTPNAIMLFGPNGGVSRTMPRSVAVPVNGSARPRFRKPPLELPIFS